MVAICDSTNKDRNTLQSSVQCPLSKTTCIDMKIHTKSHNIFVEKNIIQTITLNLQYKLHQIQKHIKKIQLLCIFDGWSSLKTWGKKKIQSKF